MRITAVENCIGAEKIQQKVTSNRALNLEPRTLGALHLQCHAFPSELSWQGLIERYLKSQSFIGKA